MEFDTSNKKFWLWQSEERVLLTYENDRWANFTKKALF